MDQVKPSELYTAARIADALVYAAGVAGVVAGGLLYVQTGELGFTLVAWVLTFCVGAGLRLIAWSTKGVAQLLERTETLIEEVAHLARSERQAPAAPPASREPRSGEPGSGEPRPRDPYERWGGWH